MALRQLRYLNNMIMAHPLTRYAPLAAWARFASWQFRSRAFGKQTIGWVSGQRLLVHRGMTGATGNIYVGLHEFPDMMLPLHLLRAGDLFLDIGANIGSYTVLASGVCRAHTLAFEPDPVTAGFLRDNVKLNALECLVTIHEIALGPETGDVDFTLGLDTINRVVEADEADRQLTRRVEQRRLDDVLGDMTPLMMKLDVEGYEEHVLRGATRTLHEPKLKVLEIETLSEWIEGSLEQHGFVRRFYDPFTRLLTAKPNTFEARNALFVRDEAFVSARLSDAPKIEIMGLRI